MEQVNLFIRISKFGNDHPNGFTSSDIMTDENVIKNIWEKKIIKLHIKNALDSGQTKRLEVTDAQGFCSRSEGIIPAMDSMFFVVERDGIDNAIGDKFILSHNATFNYIDYLELQAAKQSSADANKNAKIALWAVVITMIISICLTYWQIISTFENSIK